MNQAIRSLYDGMRSSRHHFSALGTLLKILITFVFDFFVGVTKAIVAIATHFLTIEDGVNRVEDDAHEPARHPGKPPNVDAEPTERSRCGRKIKPPKKYIDQF